MKKNILFVVNPVSGTRGKTDFIAAVHEHFRGSDFNIEVALTTYAGEATVFAKKAAAENYQIVVAVGGDGTVNEVASGLVGSQTALFIAPFGSGNGLARHLGYPLDDFEALLRLPEKEKFRAIDVGEVNGEYFFAVAGIGFDAHIAHAFAREKKRGFGTYLRKFFSEYGNFSPFDCTIKSEDGEKKKRYFVLSVANTSEYGNGAKISPSAIDNDGLLEICGVKPSSGIFMPFAAIALMRGTIESNAAFEKIKSAKFSITAEKPVFLHIDGEPKPATSFFDFSVHKEALMTVSC